MRIDPVSIGMAIVDERIGVRMHLCVGDFFHLHSSDADKDVRDEPSNVQRGTACRPGEGLLAQYFQRLTQSSAFGPKRVDGVDWLQIQVVSIGPHSAASRPIPADSHRFPVRPALHKSVDHPHLSAVIVYLPAPQSKLRSVRWAGAGTCITIRDTIHPDGHPSDLGTSRRRCPEGFATAGGRRP